MEQGGESPEDAGDGGCQEGAADGDGSSSSVTRQETARLLGRAEKLVAGRNDRDGLACVHKIRESRAMAARE